MTVPDMSTFKLLVAYSQDDTGNGAKNNTILLWIQIPNTEKELEHEEKKKRKTYLLPTRNFSIFSYRVQAESKETISNCTLLPIGCKTRAKRNKLPNPPNKAIHRVLMYAVSLIS